MLAACTISSLFLVALGGFAVKSQSIASVASNPPKLGNLPDSTSTAVAQNTETVLTIKAVGDTIPGSNFPKNELPSDPNMLFEAIKPSLQGADILFGNFESTLTNYPRSSKNPGRGRVFAFRTPPEYANLLKKVGFDVLSVANNHSFDFFRAGFEDTFNNIKAAGIEPVGKKDQILYLSLDKTKNIPVAFIGFSHTPGHNSVNDLASVKALVQEASKKADIVVVSVHMGAEGTSAMRVRNQQEIFYRERRGNPVSFAHAAIDNGADLILGHGPHVPRAMELYKGKLIAYSLGNFLGYKTLSTKGEKGYSLILDAKLNPEGDFVSGNIIPVHLNGEGIPQPDNQCRSVELIRTLTQKDFPNTPLTIHNNGQISKTSDRIQPDANIC